MADHDSDASATIIILRPSGGWADALRSYGISIDGSRVGQVGPGERLILPVQPGMHIVRAHIDWTGSPELPLEVADGEEIELDVRPSGGSLRLDRYFGTRRYLKLEPYRYSPKRFG